MNNIKYYEYDIPIDSLVSVKRIPANHKLMLEINNVGKNVEIPTKSFLRVMRPMDFPSHIIDIEDAKNIFKTNYDLFDYLPLDGDYAFFADSWKTNYFQQKVDGLMPQPN